MIIKLNNINRLYRCTRKSREYHTFKYEISLANPDNNPYIADVLSILDRRSKGDNLHCGVILANLLKNYSMNDYYTSYSMGESKLIDRYNGFRLIRNRLKTLVKMMHSSNLVEMIPGYVDFSNRKKLVSKLRATPKLIELALEHFPEGVEIVRPVDDRETIVLRSKTTNMDSKGKLIDYSDTEQVKRMRRRLECYNRLIQKTSVTLDPTGVNDDVLKDVDFSKCFTYRVFNCSWNRGGRFYGGWWLDIPSDQRRHILIDGEPTVEIDFCNQALVLLYAKEGVHFGDLDIDGYTLPQFKDQPHMREIVKKLFTISINCSSKKQAIQAFLKDYSGSLEVDPRYILDAFLNSHPRIAHHLFRKENQGLHLQNLDSHIADEVLRLMTKNRIPVLCIHDSFICGIQHEDILHSVMEQAYFRILKEKLGISTRGCLRLKHH